MKRKGAYVPAWGEAVWVTLDPQAGREQAGRRPALVLSPAAYNGRVGLALLFGVGISTLAWMGVGAVRGLVSEQFLPAPLSLWLLAVFSLAYLLFFVYPVFLNSDRVMASEADLQMRMQGIVLLGAFLKLTPYAAESQMDDQHVYEGVEKALRKYFGKRGERVVQDNLTCVKRGYSEMKEIPREVMK